MRMIDLNTRERKNVSDSLSEHMKLWRLKDFAGFRWRSSSRGGCGVRHAGPSHEGALRGVPLLGVVSIELRSDTRDWHLHVGSVVSGTLNHPTSLLLQR